MATFAKTTFSATSYAAFRPTYPQKLFERVFQYHRGGKERCLDLGCGTGIVTREIGMPFGQTIGTDPSAGMIKQARQNTPKEQFPHTSYEQAPAESAPFIADDSMDMVVAGQAAHWFDYAKFWPELARMVKRGGTFACWGYKDHVFVDYPKASEILQKYTYDLHPDKMGSYWPQPGRSYVQDHLRVVRPPTEQWEDIQRIEYEPATNGRHSGEGECWMERRMKIGECKEYMRTWSCAHGWQEAHPDRVRRDKGGPGDIMDEVFDVIAKETPEFADEERQVDVEWGWGMVMARRR